MKAKKWLLSIVVLIILSSNVMFTLVANAYEKLYDGKMITYLLEEGDSEELPDNMEKQMISLANLYNYKDYKVEDYRVVLLKEGDFIYVLQGNKGHYYTNKVTYDKTMKNKNAETELKVKPFRGTICSAPGVYRIMHSMFVVERYSKNNELYNNSDGICYLMPVMAMTR